MDAISEERLKPVNPVLVDRVRGLEVALGFDIRITQGLRSHLEQTALYAQGRMAIEIVNSYRKAVKWAPISADENVKVTDAPPCHSWHEYGLAVDVVPMTPIPDFNESHPTWKKIVQTAADFDLRDGVSWRDEPHLQPMELPLSPTPVYVATVMGNDGIAQSWKISGLLPPPAELEMENA